MRLIDADRLEEILIPKDVSGGYWGYGFLKVILDQEPTIDAEPVRHGKWEKHLIEREEYLCYKIVCSCCGGKPLYDEYGSPYHSDYCMHCGAKMDGGNDEKRV